MKRILLGLFCIFSLARHTEAGQDIVLKSRFDLNSSAEFIEQLRIFLRKNNFPDPYQQILKKPITIDLASAMNEIPEDTQRWIRELQSVLRVQAFESNYLLTFEKLGYVLEDFNSEFRAGESSRDRVEYLTRNFVKGLRLKAEKMSFEVELKRTQTREPIRFKVQLIEPEFVVSPELTAGIHMGWGTSILPENVLLTLDSIDISDVMKRIVKNPHLIDLYVKDISIPDVSIKVGNKTVTFDQQKIKKFFITREEELKKGVLDLLNENMGERFSNLIRDNSKELLLPKRYFFKADFNGVLELQRMAVNRTGIVQFDLGGHFCEDEKYLEENFCTENQIVAKERRKIDERSFQRSLREMNRALIERQKNIALSLSEHYLNQIVETTIKIGLWDEPFRGKNFKMGPEKSFVLAEDKGELFSLYLDIIYPLQGSERILVGRSELRFPVKFMIALKVEELEGIPHFTIKVKKVATDEKLILEGLPQYGLPTTVATVPRFRNKVIQRILADVNSFQGRTLIDIEMKELQGTYLHEMEFNSDGQGRGTATIGFSKERK